MGNKHDVEKRLAAVVEDLGIDNIKRSRGMVLSGNLITACMHSRIREGRSTLRAPKLNPATLIMPFIKSRTPKDGGLLEEVP